MKKLITAIVLTAVLATTAATALATGQPPVDDVPEGCVLVIDVAEVWANFSPNDSQATFVGPALYPVDARGTWNVHDSIPGGHVGPDGVYSKGNPAKGGNWFYRQAEVSHLECDEEPPTCEEDPTQEGCEEEPPPTCETDPALCEPGGECGQVPCIEPDDPADPANPPKVVPVEPEPAPVSRLLPHTV